MSAAIPTTQYETDAVRVTRWELPPGASTGEHVHQYDYVVVPLTDGVLTVTDQSGATTEAALAVGGTYGRSAGVHHDVANRTGETVVFVELEMLEHGIDPAPGAAG